MELHKIYHDTDTRLVAFAQSRIGGRSENQDFYGWADTSLGYLVTVCDGMGGGPGGKTASNIAVQEIVTCINQSEEDQPQDPKNLLIKAIRRANQAILEKGAEHKELRGMGSTATILLVTPKSALIAHVGDSRVYQFRGGEKVFRTFDHSLVFEMVKQGVITEEQARLSAQSNVITRALGIKPDIEVEINEVPYVKGDRFLLCTDGVHGAMPETDLSRLACQRHKSLGVTADNIATKTDDIGFLTGGRHANLTLALVEMKTNSTLPCKMTKKAKYIILTLTVLLCASVAGNLLSASMSVSTATTKLTTNDSICIKRCDSLLQQNEQFVREIKQLNEKVEKHKAFRDSVMNLTERMRTLLKK